MRRERSERREKIQKKSENLVPGFSLARWIFHFLKKKSVADENFFHRKLFQNFFPKTFLFFSSPPRFFRRSFLLQKSTTFFFDPRTSDLFLFYFYLFLFYFIFIIYLFFLPPIFKKKSQIFWSKKNFPRFWPDFLKIGFSKIRRRAISTVSSFFITAPCRGGPLTCIRPTQTFPAHPRPASELHKLFGLLFFCPRTGPPLSPLPPI